MTDSLLPDADVITQVSTSGGGEVDVFRPFAVRPTVVGPAVAPTSSSRFNWEVRIRPGGGGTDADMPAATNWNRFVSNASFFVHAGTGGVSVLRYALGGEAQISENRETRRVFYELVNGHEPVAIGVELDVDAFRVLIKPPSTVEGFELNSDERRLRQLRRDRFAHIVRDQLGGVQQTGPFLAGWLAELTLAAIAHQAINTNDSDTLLENWSETDWKENLTEAFDRSFQGLHTDNGETGDGTREGEVHCLWTEQHSKAAAHISRLNSAMEKLRVNQVSEERTLSTIEDLDFATESTRLARHTLKLDVLNNLLATATRMTDVLIPLATQHSGSS